MILFQKQPTLAPVVGEVVGKRGRRVNMVHMYVNAKIIPAETTPGMEEGRNKGERWRW
jgi:hypothetical protein